MIALHFQGDNFEEVIDRLKKFLDGQNQLELKKDAPATTNSEESTAATSDEVPVSPEVSQPQKRSRGRPPKAIIHEPQATPDQSIPDILEVRAAIQKVIDKHGMGKAQELIGEFGKLKYSEIPKEQWAKVIERAKELST